MTLLQKINNLTWWNEIAKLKDILKELLPQAPTYKVYTALLSQTGTDAPVATVLENTLGNITFEYVSEGVFNVVEAFDDNNTSVIIGTANNGGNNVIQAYVDSGILGIYTAVQSVEEINGLINTPTNGILSNTHFEIRVYN